jgi:hypothetical protein
MNTIKTGLNLSRRDFIKLLGVTGAAAAGGFLLDTYAPWVDYENQADEISKPFQQNTAKPAQMLEMVRYATLAANGHNTQPWKFAIKEDEIEIHPDYSRHLPVVDPNNRELWISLGCALENLMVSAYAAGYTPDVTYPDESDFIHIRLSNDTPQKSPLFDAIPVRQNTRSEFDGQAVKKNELDLLQGLTLEPGVNLHFVTNPTDLEKVVDYVNQGNLNQYADDAFINELIYWLRFNKKDALATNDGLYSVCSGNPAVPGWLGRLFVASTKPEQQADLDAKKLRSSAGAVVITSALENKSAWVRAGQVYERLALKMTTLDIKSAFLNQPIEVTNLRSQFQSSLGLEKALPQLIVRFGYADTMPRSLRRPVEQVLI